MPETSYAVRVSEMLETTLAWMEDNAALADLDMDLVDGVLKVEFQDGSQIIINRQEPLEQIWLASPSGPAHFRFDDDRGEWVDDRTGERFQVSLERALSEKLGIPVNLCE